MKCPACGVLVTTETWDSHGCRAYTVGDAIGLRRVRITPTSNGETVGATIRVGAPVPGPVTKRRPVVAKRATTATPREIATRIVYGYTGVGERGIDGGIYWSRAEQLLRDRIARAISKERSGGKGRDD